MSSRPGAKPYTVASTAPRAAIDAAHRGVLLALRAELDILCVEVRVDVPWPADVAWAVQTLHTRRRPWRILLTRRPIPTEITDDLRPAEHQDFAIASALVPYTLSATGITHDGQVAYSTCEDLHESYFQLTEVEHAVATDFMADRGSDPDLLIQEQA